jgi:RNA polymerase II-associated protein 3
MTMPPDKEVECLLEHLKTHFRKMSPSQTASQLAQHKEQLTRGLPEGTSVDQRMLNMATSLQLVETVSLLSQSKDNGFVGINLYVDDAGVLKGLPVNMRATELAHCCGRPIEVRGDAFLARVMDNGDDFQRLDFGLSEVSSAAEWVKRAQQQAAKRREAESSESVLRRMDVRIRNSGGHHVARVRELSPAEAAKEEGNAAFQHGDWEQAIRHYDRALELQKDMLPARNNRAMALLKLQRWEEALSECEKVLQSQPNNVKALLRAATSEVELNRTDHARRRLESALQAQPNNKEAREKLDKLSQA